VTNVREQPLWVVVVVSLNAGAEVIPGVRLMGKLAFMLLVFKEENSKKDVRLLPVNGCLCCSSIKCGSHQSFVPGGSFPEVR